MKFVGLKEKMKEVKRYDFPYLAKNKELPKDAQLPHNVMELTEMTLVMCEFFGASRDANVLNIRNTIIELCCTTDLYEYEAYELMAEFFSKGSLSFNKYRFKK